MVDKDTTDCTSTSACEKDIVLLENWREQFSRIRKADDTLRVELCRFSESIERWMSRPENFSQLSEWELGPSDAPTHEDTSEIQEHELDELGLSLVHINPAEAGPASFGSADRPPEPVNDVTNVTQFGAAVGDPNRETTAKVEKIAQDGQIVNNHSDVRVSRSEDMDSFMNPLGCPSARVGRQSVRGGGLTGGRRCSAANQWRESDSAERMHWKKAAARSVNSLQSETRTGIRYRTEELLRNPFSEFGIAMCIIGNAIVVGLEVDYTVSNPTSSAPIWIVVLGHMFNCAFAVEVSLRMFAFRCAFFTGSQRTWNLFDFILVLSAVTEVILQSITALASGSNVYSMRMVRLIRVTRILRVIRVARVVSFLMALRLLVVQIIGTLRACFWALSLLVLILYSFGMVFAQITSDFLKEENDDNALDPDDLIMKKYWSTVPRAMYTLYKSISGGIDWEIAVRPLAQVHWFWVLIFNVFLAFTLFAVLNVVVGVFCQSAIQSAANDHENAIRIRMQEKSDFMHKITKLFEEVDQSGDGNVTYSELEDHLDNDRVCAYFVELGLDPSDAWDLFKLLDKDGSTLINHGEFIEGCLRLKGVAKVIDIEKLQYENRHMRRRLWAFIRKTETALDRIEAVVGPQILQIPITVSPQKVPSDSSSPRSDRMVAL